jgi:transposase InsO family protein
VNADLLRRDCTFAQPNRKWVTDLTEHPTAEGKIYCYAIKNLFSNRIVGHAESYGMTADLAVTALRTALAQHESDGVVIVHADRGSRFRVRSFKAVLKAAGHFGSMGRVTSAGNSAAMECISALVRRNVPNARS